MRILGLIGFLACFAGAPVMAQSVDFGTDNGQWSNDGECDDPRFEGPGMTTTPLLSDDVLRDATDCRTAFEAGRLSLRGIGKGGVIDFGDDSGEWANDGECDDMRFAGPGMTTTPLLFEDIMADATDCRSAFDAGQLALVSSEDVAEMIVDGVNFGNDNGQWSNDGECDDPRFEGSGMTSTPLLSDDVLRDATDCLTAFEAGRLSLRGVSADGTIDFGDDSGEWANDNECDDMRFAGPGMTSTPLLFEDIMTDATDCRTAFEAGRLTLAGQ